MWILSTKNTSIFKLFLCFYIFINWRVYSQMLSLDKFLHFEYRQTLHKNSHGEIIFLFKKNMIRFKIKPDRFTTYVRHSIFSQSDSVPARWFDTTNRLPSPPSRMLVSRPLPVAPRIELPDSPSLACGQSSRVINSKLLNRNEFGIFEQKQDIKRVHSI